MKVFQPQHTTKRLLISDEGHKPKHIDMTVKLFYTIAYSLLPYNNIQTIFIPTPLIIFPPSNTTHRSYCIYKLASHFSFQSHFECCFSSHGAVRSKFQMWSLTSIQLYLSMSQSVSISILLLVQITIAKNPLIKISNE